jgi:hypothetical protein
MRRRNFLVSSVGAAGLGAAATEGEGGPPADGAPGAEYYELRLYRLRTGPMRARMDEYLRDVSIPALNRAGVSPVGAFSVVFGADSPALYLLLPYRSLADFGALEDRLASDQQYQRASAAHRDLPPSDPAYVRIDSQLMVAFPGMPKLEVPAAAAGNKPRLFELRTYESHSKKAHKTKVEMFGKGGEIAIFRRTGLTPVFFGQNLIGSRLPSLTYMLVFDDLAARERNWAAFVADPEWKKLSATPGYTNEEIVTNITSLILRPTPYSQV